MQRADPMIGEMLIRLSDVLHLTSLSRSTLYRLVERGEFPEPVRSGKRIMRWRHSDVQKWMQGR